MSSISPKIEVRAEVYLVNETGSSGRKSLGPPYKLEFCVACYELCLDVPHHHPKPHADIGGAFQRWVGLEHEPLGSGCLQWLIHCVELRSLGP